MQDQEADALQTIAKAAIDLFQQSPFLAFVSIAFLVAALSVAAWITRRLKRRWPAYSWFRILVDYLSTVVLTFAMLLGSIRLFSATLGNGLMFMAGGVISLLLISRVIAAVVELLFRPDEPFRSILRAVSVLIWITVCIYLFGHSNPSIRNFFDTEIAIGGTQFSVQDVLGVVFFGAIVLIVAIWAARTSRRYLRGRKGLQPNMVLALDRISSVAIWIVAAMVIVSLSGINLTALAAFGGALGIGLGLGLQSLAASYVSGLIVLFERSVKIGDNLVTDKIKGKVTQMTIRYTTIHTTDGLDVLVPNNTLINGTIFNETLSDSDVRLELPVTVSIDADLAAARAILHSAVAQHRRVLKHPPVRVYTASIVERNARLLARFWISDPGDGRLDVISDINELLLDEFKKNNIRFT